MCAIAGWLDPKTSLDPQSLDVMLAALVHRGPDDRGSHHSPDLGLALGHNRLSIIDLSPGGRQPMINEANQDVLVFNGEIFNFREVKLQLQAKGHRFRSQSDTEVLLKAFEEWGPDLTRHIRGMFAFAVWKSSERTLYLFRDPMGIKPLYYWLSPLGALVFASEIKAFLTLPIFEARMDRSAVGEFLEFGYTFEPERSILAGVRRLPPGHYLRFTLGEALGLHRYFAPSLAPLSAPEMKDLEDDLLSTLRLVVEQHLIADVPVALLLSGGLDSSLLAALAAERTRIRTLSMGFEGSSVDERPHAAKVANFIGSDHSEILIRPTEILNGLVKSISLLDDVFADWGAVSTRLLYAKCRELGIKVVIVGEGADELFGGYDIFKKTGAGAPVDLWLFSLYRAYSGRRYGAYFPAFRSVMRQHLEATGGDRFAAVRLFESRNQLPANYVMKVDKASMSVSVEARVPFLDQRIAEIAYRIPRAQLVTASSEKNVLRSIAARHHLLPDEILSRRKFGAGIASEWMETSPEFRAFAAHHILKGEGWTERLGLKRAMNDYFVRNRAGYPFPSALSIFRNLAWRLLILELWTQFYKVSPSAG